MSYWELYYNNTEYVSDVDLQKNVGRTVDGKVVSKKIWERTLSYIKKTVALKSTDDLLELCCGNGQVIEKLANNCNSALGVDFSKELLNQLHSLNNHKIQFIQGNVLELNLKEKKFDVILIYFSIQHFTEKETIHLIEKSIKWLNKGGRLLIGDVPNLIKKWDYINKPSYRIDYLQRVLLNQPKIGNWFHPSFFEAIGDYFEEISLEILMQPEFQFNSKYRFDVLIKKIDD